jgi:two-component system NarL family sensor kinase
MPLRPFRSTAVRFLLAYLLVTAIVAAAAVGWSSVAARAQALQATAEAALTDAGALIAPLCTAGLQSGEPGAVQAVDRAVRGHLHDGSVLRVKVWSAQGRVLYSDADSLIGRSFPLEREERELLGTAEAVAEVSALDRPENDFEAAAGHLVEAYAAISGVDGDPLLYEAYYVVDRLDAAASREAWAIIPLALLTVFGLYLLQAPLLVGLARGIDRAHRKRRGRLRLVSAKAELDRARIAADLRDGVVADLAGVSYLLGAAPDNELVEPARRILTEDLRRLRRTVDELGAPDPARTGLWTALDDALRPLRTAGVRCDLSVRDTALDEDRVRLVHRAVRELVRGGTAPVAVELRGGVLTVTGAGPEPPVDLLALAVRDAGGSYERTGDKVRVALDTVRVAPK